MHFVVTEDNVVELVDTGEVVVLRSEPFEDRGSAFEALAVLKSGAAGAPVEVAEVVLQREEELENPPEPPSDVVADPVEERRAVEEAAAVQLGEQAEREAADREKAQGVEQKAAKAGSSKKDS